MSIFKYPATTQHGFGAPLAGMYIWKEKHTSKSHEIRSPATRGSPLTVIFHRLFGSELSVTSALRTAETDPPDGGAACDGAGQGSEGKVGGKGRRRLNTAGGIIPSTMRVVTRPRCPALGLEPDGFKRDMSKPVVLFKPVRKNMELTLRLLYGVRLSRGNWYHSCSVTCLNDISLNRFRVSKDSVYCYPFEIL